MTNTSRKDTFVTLVGMRGLHALLMVVLFAGLAQAETAPKKTEAVPKKAPAAAKTAQPAPSRAPGTTPVPPFDHAKTGFLLRDVHTTLRCEQCHVDGVFKNTPKDCAGCHSVGSRVAATPRPVNHVQTTQPCDTCHTSPTTFLVASFKHIGVTSNCSTCHNGQSLGVVSKPANHFPTLMPCENCHNTTTFSTARMDHTGITTGCSNCHSGQFAGVVSINRATHITTTLGCESCHNTTTFLGARFDHVAAGISNTSACSTCHNGVTAKGKPAGHIMTTAECGMCHTQTVTQNFTTFLGAIFDHVAISPPVAGRCSTCHNGVTALGKPAYHIATSAECDTCHGNANNYTSFLGATFTHTGATNCSSCHNGVQAKGQSAGHIPVSGVECGNCHSVYNGTTVTTFYPGTMNHTAVTGIGCSVCHSGAYATQGLLYGGAQAKPSNHIPTTITTGLECTTCHITPGYTSPTGWSFEKMNHNNAQGMGSPIYCVTCHLKGNTYLGNMTKFSHNGASTAKDCSSSSCHKPLGRTGTVYQSWN